MVKIAAFLSLALLLVLGVLSSYASPVDENTPHHDNWNHGQPCVANEQFWWKCNICTCSPSGVGAACTRKACL